MPKRPQSYQTEAIKAYTDEEMNALLREMMGEPVGTLLELRERSPFATDDEVLPVTEAGLVPEAATNHRAHRRLSQNSRER